MCPNTCNPCTPSCSQTRPTPETVKVSFTGESESWIAGTAALMFHTTDGATWDIQAHPPRQPMLRARYDPPEEPCVRLPTWRPIRLFAVACRANRGVSGSVGLDTRKLWSVQYLRDLRPFGP